MNRTRWWVRIVGIVCGCSLSVVLTGSGAKAAWPPVGGAVGQPAVTNAPVDQYYPNETGHWVSLVLDRGAKVKLEDGSVWELAFKHQLNTRDWRVAQKISVSRNPNERYPFKLTNLDQKAAADARLLYRPF